VLQMDELACGSAVRSEADAAVQMLQEALNRAAQLNVNLGSQHQPSLASVQETTASVQELNEEIASLQAENKEFCSTITGLHQGSGEDSSEDVKEFENAVCDVRNRLTDMDRIERENLTLRTELAEMREKQLRVALAEAELKNRPRGLQCFSFRKCQGQ